MVATNSAGILQVQACSPLIATCQSFCGDRKTFFFSLRSLHYSLSKQTIASYMGIYPLAFEHYREKQATARHLQGWFRPLAVRTAAATEHFGAS